MPTVQLNLFGKAVPPTAASAGRAWQRAFFDQHIRRGPAAANDAGGDIFRAWQAAFRQRARGSQCCQEGEGGVSSGARR